MVDSFLRLGHHRVVGGYHNDGNVRHLGTTGTHGRKGFVTRRIQERNSLARLGPHLVGTNVLRDAAGLALGHTRIADVVKQRRFAVVDVAHDGHDGGAGAQVLGAVAGIHVNLLFFGRQEFHVETEFVGNHGDGFGIEALVDGHEHAHAQTHLNHLVHVHVHQ